MTQPSHKYKTAVIKRNDIIWESHEKPITTHISKGFGIRYSIKSAWWLASVYIYRAKLGIFVSNQWRVEIDFLLAFFTFFYVSRRKYWFRANFRFPVLDGFTRFGMSWTRFDYFWKMSVCLCVCVSVSLCVCVSMTKILWQVQLEN